MDQVSLENIFYSQTLATQIQNMSSEFQSTTEWGKRESVWGKEREIMVIAISCIYSQWKNYTALGISSKRQRCILNDQ